jgi:hypothetical protein
MFTNLCPHHIGDRELFLIVDHFTGHTWSKLFPTQDARPMAEFLFETIKNEGTLPDAMIRVQSDNGKCFVDAEVCMRWGVCAGVHARIVTLFY